MRGVVVVVGLVLTLPAFAQDAEPISEVTEARALFERGSELTRQRRFSEAAESYARSAELVERPSTLFNLASTLKPVAFLSASWKSQIPPSMPT